MTEMSEKEIGKQEEREAILGHLSRRKEACQKRADRDEVMRERVRQIEVLEDDVRNGLHVIDPPAPIEAAPPQVQAPDHVMTQLGER